MAQLRHPEIGCPWDVKQDFNSLIPYTIEEAYEVADAIERNDLLFDSSLRYLGDFDWINRIADASLKIKFLDKVLSMVRFHEQQTSRVHADAIKMESKLIQERHGINRLLVKITLFILHWITIVQAAWRAYNMGGMNEVRRVASLRTSR